MAFNPPAPVMPLYTRATAAPSLPRRLAVLAAQLVAAGAYGFLVVALPPTMLTLLVAPVALCLLAALWLMPDRGVFPRGIIERATTVLLTLMIVWPTYLAVVLPGLPWLTPTRMALFFVTFFFLYSVSTSAALRHHLFVVARSSTAVWICFLLWEASMFYTVPFSHNIGLTLTTLLNNQLRLVEMFFLGCLVFARRGAPTRALGLLVVLAMVCSVDGFIENQLEYPPWANHIPSFMRVDDATMTNALGAQARSSDGLYRVRSTFALSLVFAEYLAVCFPFIIHWLITSRSLLVRLAMMVAWPLVMGAVLLTHSRLGLVGALSAHVLYLPLWALRRWRADRSSIVGPFILFGAPIAVLLMVGVIFSSHTLSSRVLGNGAQAASNEARAQQRVLAVPKVLGNPIGHGLAQSGFVLGFVSIGGVITVDNHYITSLIDLGVLGTVGLYGIFISSSLVGGRLYLRAEERELDLAGPLAVSFLVFFVIKSVLSQETNHPLLFLLAGMMAAMNARSQKLFDADTVFPAAT